MLRQLRREDYTVGWVCALPIELAAAKALLDEKHESPTHDLNDDNVYCTGSIADHNVVIVCLPAGRIGNNPAAAVATHMRTAFRNIRFGLMVGIGGGVPSTRKDIRLGDVVVSEPYKTFSGVVQYDMGKITVNGFERTGSLASPPSILLSAIQTIKANRDIDESQLPTYLAELEHYTKFQRHKAGPDILFEPNYNHEGDESCQACDPNRQVDRNQRERGQEVEVHYGTIASGNAVMRSASERDKTSRALGDIICFEMEAAGLMNTFPCLVIRGICDYADSHKNKRWQPYAAGAAAAYAKEVLSVIPGSNVSRTLPLQEASIEGPPSKRRRIETTYAPEDESIEPSQQEASLPTRHRDLNNASADKEEQQRNLLESLMFESIYARQTNIRNAHFRTCKWLLHNQQYIDWLDHRKLDEHHGFLWIKGKPGAGKSTLMKYISTNVAKTMKDWTVISFFFNARGEAIESSTEGAYRSLLVQLFRQFPALQSNLLSPGIAASDISQERQWSVESLKSLLEDTILSPGKPPVILFIDALDECDEEQIRDMVSLFERLGELAMLSSIRLRVCFSSRLYPHITIANGLDLMLDQEDEHKHDIATYLGSELKIGKSKLAEQVRGEVQQKASGVFMWVVLVTRILNKEYDKGRMHALRKRLKDIPQDLHDLFEDIINRDSYRRDELMLCIQWVLFAKQSLSPEQLYLAISSGIDIDEASAWNQEIMDSQDIERSILNYSKGLVEITKSRQRKVQFIHESVRDFLLKGNGLINIWPSFTDNFEGKSHEKLRQCCLSYFNSVAHSDRYDSEPPSPEELRVKAPFLEYAVHQIMYHADEAERSGISQSQFLDEFQVPRWVVFLNSFEKFEVRRHSQLVSLLYLLAEHSMVHLTRAYASANSCFKIEDERYGCPLLAAMAVNSQETVEALLESCRAPQCSGSDKKGHIRWDRSKITTTFRFSKRQGLVQYLLDFGFNEAVAILSQTDDFDPTSRNYYGITPWYLMENSGDIRLLQLLLNNEKLDISLRDTAKSALLSQLILKEDFENATILFETGRVYINFRPPSRELGYPTTWFLAVIQGKIEAVKFLLETCKADYNAKDAHGNTAVHLAAYGGHIEIVQLLLEFDDLDINKQNFEGDTALSQAASMGRCEIVQMLLAKDANINAENQSRYTALSLAVIGKHTDVVQLLLEKGADVHSTDADQYNALFLAVDDGSTEILKLLLERNADIHSKDKTRGTALALAADGGQLEAVKLLLAEKIDINSKDERGDTPLILAARKGHLEIVQLLLSHEADINTKNHIGETALSQVVSMGHDLIVELLLREGKTEVDTRSSQGRTPLFEAVRLGRLRTMRLLLETRKADIHAKDHRGNTPLSIAGMFLRNEGRLALLQSYDGPSV